MKVFIERNFFKLPHPSASRSYSCIPQIRCYFESKYLNCSQWKMEKEPLVNHFSATGCRYINIPMWFFFDHENFCIEPSHPQISSIYDRNGMSMQGDHLGSFRWVFFLGLIFPVVRISVTNEGKKRHSFAYCVRLIFAIICVQCIPSLFLSLFAYFSAKDQQWQVQPVLPFAIVIPPAYKISFVEWNVVQINHTPITLTHPPNYSDQQIIDNFQFFAVFNLLASNNYDEQTVQAFQRIVESSMNSEAFIDYTCVLRDMKLKLARLGRRMIRWMATAPHTFQVSFNLFIFFIL